MVHVPSLLIIQIQFTLIRTVLQLGNIPSFLLALTGVVHVPLQTLKQFTLIRTVLQHLDNIPSFLLALTGVVHVPLQTLNPTVSLSHRNIYHKKFENSDFRPFSCNGTRTTLWIVTFFLIVVTVTVVISLPIIFRFLTASGTRTTPEHKTFVSQTRRHIYHNFENKYFFRLLSKWYVYHSLNFYLLRLLLL